MAFRVTSPAFEHGMPIPTQFTCEGADVSPPLRWEGVPEGAKSLVLVCSDPDAPAGTWYHWAVFDIPPETLDLREHLPKDARADGVRQAVNDFRRTGYGGPCPPKGHGVHHYHFRLMALDVEHLVLPDWPMCRDVERAATQHGLATAELIGIYERV